MIRSIELREVARAAAVEAGVIALEGFRSASLEVTQKTGFHDLVTAYDRACEARIREVIQAAEPGSRILGEEQGVSGDGPVTWFVDPIDGTANFARGIALWSVSIAAAIDGEVVAGVVFDPVADHMFEADASGAYLNGEPIATSVVASPDQATVIANFPMARDLVHLRETALTRYAEVLETFATVRFFGASANSLCHVAAGWADATFSFQAQPWDVAAAALILKRAGGRYVTYGAGEQLPADAAHVNRHYLGLNGAGEFPLLDKLMREQSTRPVPHVATW